MSLTERIPRWPRLLDMRWSEEQQRAYYEGGYWSEKGIDRMLASHAEAMPGKVACADGRDQLTYAELHEQAQGFAETLIGLGLGHGDVVAVWLDNGLPSVISFYGIAAAGMVNFQVPGGTTERYVIDQLRRTETSVLITDQPVSDELAGSLAGGQVVIAVGERVSREAAMPFAEAAGARANVTRFGDPDDVGILVPTSGTTGTPKIAMRTVNSLLAMARTVVERSSVKAGDRLLIAAPIYGGVGFINAIGAVALTGCTLVTPQRLQPEPLIELVAQYGVNRIHTLPTLVTRMANSPEFSAEKVTSVEVVQTGGSFLQPGMAAALENAFDCSVVIVYGAIDVGTPAMVSLENDPPERRSSTVGRLAPGAEMRIADASGNQLPNGEVGEVVMRGPDMALGYFDDEEATSVVFDRDGWGHFGDLGVLDDAGYLRIVGRLKEIINRGGKKISTAEVETAVSSHELVREVAAVGYHDDDLGERCAVFVVTRDHKPLSLDDLRRHLDAIDTPKYMWPERVECITSMPLSAAGKVRRDELRALLSETKV